MLIVEKRWPKNKPVLEVQRLPNTVDLIAASNTSKFTTSPFHILEIYFPDNFPLYRIIFVLVLPFSEFDNTHWMSHWKCDICFDSTQKSVWMCHKLPKNNMEFQHTKTDYDCQLIRMWFLNSVRNFYRNLTNNLQTSLNYVGNCNLLSLALSRLSNFVN